MCRKAELLGFVLIALGAGFFLSCFIVSLFWRILIGAVLLAIGFLFQKCR